MAAPEVRDGWFPDPFGRYDERFFVYGEPSRLVRTAGIAVTDPHGVGVAPRGKVSPPQPLRDAHVEPVDLRFAVPPRRASVLAWAVFAALCAIGALLFVNIPVSVHATTAAGRTVSLACGSVTSPQAPATARGFVGDVPACSSRRAPLAGVAFVFGLLALFGIVRVATAVRADRGSVHAAPGLPTVDLHEPVELYANGEQVLHGNDRLVGVTGSDRAS
jgi:hypothetical protein